MKVDDLLKAERSRGGFSKEEREAMWKGIELSVGPASAASSGTSDTSDTKNASNDEATQSPAASAAASASAPGAMASAMKIGALLSAVALGGALGAAAHATLASPAVVYVDRVTTVPAASALASAVAPVSVPDPVPLPAVSSLAASSSSWMATPRTSTPRALPSTPSVSPSPKDPGLARERTLLDMSRTALTRGDSNSALGAAETHEREFPRSQLAEEREVLFIQALAAGNRLPEAQARVTKFGERYPKSPLLPMLIEATRGK